MRTTLNIEDELIQKASKLTGIKEQRKAANDLPN
jgi:Arc/MetJ family transcription regulator